MSGKFRKNVLLCVENISGFLLFILPKIIDFAATKTDYKNIELSNAGFRKE